VSNPYLGEIRMFAGNFAPQGWMFCNGQLLPIADYDSLWILIGTTYGGDGQVTFALPDLRGRVPMHQGPGYVQGQQAGVESVTLSASQIPAHSHVVQGSSANASTTSPVGNVPATMGAVTTFLYGTDAPSTALAPPSVSLVGGSQPHENMHPFLCVSFIISVFGVFPTST
jgi:microcystin-dependent protein